MTNELARNILSELKKLMSEEKEPLSEEQEALSMAISALKQEPTSEMVHVETLRQVMWERDIAIGQLKELGYEFGQKIEPCEDTISRADAIDQMEQSYNILDATNRIKALPSVTPSRRKGHWIETEYHRYRCPICREKGMSDWDNIHDKKTDFCPNCGAVMRTEDKGDYAEFVEPFLADMRGAE